MKQKAQEVIMWEIRSQLKGWRTGKPVFLIFKWVEPNRKRDMDNVAFAKKFIQDAMVKAGVIDNDGWNHVVGFMDLFYTDKSNPGVEVLIMEVMEVGDE